MLSPRRTRSTLARWLALALACAAVPAGAQNPAQDTVKAPAASAGTAQQQLVTVPELDGRTVDEARRLLAAAGLELGRVAEGSGGGGTPGTVMQQQPRAGSAAAPKSDVRLWLVPQAVASGPARPPVFSRPSIPTPPILRQPPAQQPAQEARVTVPPLVGRTVEDARVVLSRADLEVASVGELAGTGTPGTVVRQSPQPGAAVAPGAGVQLWVAPARVAQKPRDTLVIGAPARRVVVPAILGLPRDRAEALVRQAGLQTGKVRGEGRVVGHTFEAGQSVPAGSIVDLSLGAPAGGVGQVAARPDPAAAQPQPPARPPTPPAQDPGTSTPPATQPPAADSAAAQPPVAQPLADSAAVPDVRRLALPQAQAALAAAGLGAAFDPALADSSGWTVSAQQPSPGGRLAAGGVVALLLDPPAPLAGTAAAQPPLANGPQPDAAVVRPPLLERRVTWIALAVLLLAAAAAGAQRMRARKPVPPLAGVRARLRMDAPARVAVEGAPFGDARLRFRMNPGRTAARVSAAGPLFVHKEVSGD
jgi:beta-lactam-binding protein with PASTA domain